jgi:hypothetical protein
MISVIVAVPNGDDPHGRPGYIPGAGYQKDLIPAGQVLTFLRVIPKACVTREANQKQWQDSYDEMLFCEWRPGQRAWLNIRNARKV